MNKNIVVSKQVAKNIWIHAQKIDQKHPFGKGPSAVSKAISHLGYVQIDTIHVIERCHHHILYNRIPDYKTNYLHRAQSQEKSIFEYWTHALSYVPTADYKYYMRKMKSIKKEGWYFSVSESEYKKVQALLKKGALGIRDIKDDILVEKTHLWGSSKPSKKALELGFYTGEFAISERTGIIKKYDLTKRHFNWKSEPKAATENECCEYIMNRALRSQGLVSLDSICYLNAKMKKPISGIIAKKIKNAELVEVEIESLQKVKFYTNPEVLESSISTSKLTHILSPFDPLVIQRKRLKMFFDYEHLFEVYLPKEKRKYGYFTLPVLHKNNFIALLDLKTDRAQKKLLIQNWVWLEKYKSAENKKTIEAELHRFEKFQLNK